MWTSWNIKIAYKAFKEIRPLEMEIRPEIIDVVTSHGVFWNTTEEKKTGNWVIKFKYDRGPMTSTRVTNIVFKQEQEAVWWFNHIWTNVFCAKDHVVPPPPKSKASNVKKLPVKRDKKGNHLRLV